MPGRHREVPSPEAVERARAELARRHAAIRAQLEAETPERDEVVNAVEDLLPAQVQPYLHPFAWHLRQWARLARAGQPLSLSCALRLPDRERLARDLPGVPVHRWLTRFALPLLHLGHQGPLCASLQQHFGVPLDRWAAGLWEVLFDPVFMAALEEADAGVVGVRLPDVEHGCHRPAPPHWAQQPGFCLAFHAEARDRAFFFRVRIAACDPAHRHLDQE